MYTFMNNWIAIKDQSKENEKYSKIIFVFSVYDGLAMKKK
jgi:hypothetical protein